MDSKQHEMSSLHEDTFYEFLKVHVVYSTVTDLARLRG
jgi:hypothetical protein